MFLILGIKLTSLSWQIVSNVYGTVAFITAEHAVCIFVAATKSNRKVK